jgi:hypothetical protein
MPNVRSALRFSAEKGRRFSDWVVVHPVLWGVGLGVVLVVLGFAFDLAPIVVISAGAVIGVLNILHAKRRGYCPYPAAGPHPARTEADEPSGNTAATDP